MSTVLPATKGIGAWAQPLLEFLGTKTKTQGWPFLAAWAHRISGILLILYVWFHIITLSSLTDPGSFDAKMKVFGFVFFVFFEWLLSIPVIFHALNGGRLIQNSYADICNFNNRAFSKHYERDIIYQEQSVVGRLIS